MLKVNSQTFVYLLTLLLFHSAGAEAAPGREPPRSGHYAFAGDFTVSLKLHLETVYAFTPAGRARLEELVKAGEECMDRGRDTFLCRVFQPTGGAADLVRAEVIQRTSGLELVLGERRGEPAVISEGTYTSVYQVNQPASYAGKTYAAYRLVNAGGHWSIRLGDSGSDEEVQFNLSLSGDLLLPFDVSQKESKLVRTVYSVDALFRRM